MAHHLLTAWGGGGIYPPPNAANILAFHHSIMGSSRPFHSTFIQILLKFQAANVANNCFPSPPISFLPSSSSPGRTFSPRSYDRKMYILLFPIWMMMTSCHPPPLFPPFPYKLPNKFCGFKEIQDVVLVKMRGRSPPYFCVPTHKSSFNPPPAPSFSFQCTIFNFQGDSSLLGK